jgi:hypothetical protein
MAHKIKNQSNRVDSSAKGAFLAFWNGLSLLKNPKAKKSWSFSGIQSFE